MSDYANLATCKLWNREGLYKSNGLFDKRGPEIIRFDTVLLKQYSERAAFLASQSGRALRLTVINSLLLRMPLVVDGTGRQFLPAAGGMQCLNDVMTKHRKPWGTSPLLGEHDMALRGLSFVDRQ